MFYSENFPLFSTVLIQLNVFRVGEVYQILSTCADDMINEATMNYDASGLKQTYCFLHTDTVSLSLADWNADPSLMVSKLPTPKITSPSRSCEVFSSP